MFDAAGQWLTSLSVFWQTVVLLAVLVPVGSVAAVALMRIIDAVSASYQRFPASRNERSTNSGSK